MLENSELKELSRIDGRRSSQAILLDWLMIAGLLGLAVRLPHPLVWLGVFILMGRMQIALAVLMHDGAHRRLYSSQKLNDWLGQFLLAAPLFFAMDSYKKQHLRHHLNPLAPDDPDLSLTGGYPISKGSFLRKILRDLTGISYFKFIRYFIYLSRKSPKGAAFVDSTPRSVSGESAPKGFSRRVVLLSVLLVHGAMLGALAWAGHAWAYFAFWVLPFMTVLQVLLRIRGIAEHAGYQVNADQRLNARTVINPLQTFFVAPHGVNYHIEHHLYPSIPFYNLPAVHDRMMSRGSIPEANFYTGYGRVIRELVR